MMSTRRFGKGRHLARELGFELRTLRHHSPDFVTRDVDRLAPGEVPVFTFHSIEPEPFEAQLRYLVDNGYRTIDGPTLCRHLRGEVPAPEKAVLLTIDDGLKSVWTYGFPLLQRYGCSATVFVIPGYVPATTGLGPNLADVWAGRVPADQLAFTDPELMTWDELRAIQQAGVIDCQSHSLFHHRVPVSATLLGFVDPGLGDHPFDVPIPAGQEWRLATAGVPGGLGLPLFESAALLRGRPRFHPAPAVVEACTRLVEEGGGARFFAQGDATARLRAAFAAAAREHGPGRLEAPDELHAAISDDLARSRAMIEAELGGKPTTQLCLPYSEGSDLAAELAAAAGYEAVYWGVLPGRRANRPGDDPLRIVRLKNDYIHRLPGEGRRSLARIMLYKVQRRAQGRPVY